MAAIGEQSRHTGPNAEEALPSVFHLLDYVDAVGMEIPEGLLDYPAEHRLIEPIAILESWNRDFDHMIEFVTIGMILKHSSDGPASSVLVARMGTVYRKSGLI